MKSKDYKYEVALSFAGEDREYVNKVAEQLKDNGVNVFYDNFEEIELWGKDLYQHLSNIYYDNSKYTVVFISKYYANKLWTTHELRSLQARAFEENEEYILPVRFDDTNIPGIMKTTGYIDARTLQPEQLCQKILAKLGKQPIIENQELSINDEFKLPKLNRKISDLDKEIFIKEGFQYTMEYFKIGLKKIESEDKDVKSIVDELSPVKFTAKIYFNGDLKSMCKIWIGSGISFEGTISYLESNRNLDVDNDGTLNDFATIEIIDNKLFFNITGMGHYNVPDSMNLNKATSKDLAIYFWSRFIKNIT